MARPAKSTVRLSLKEIATRFSVTPATVRNWIMTGTRDVEGTLHRLQAERIGSRYYVKKKWLNAYLQAMQVNVTEAPPMESEAAKQKRFRAEQEAVRRRLGG